VEGECRGWIAEEERGDGGFGYDPVFVPDLDGLDADAGVRARTFAEMTDDEKHSVSHRGRAFRALVAALDGAR
jgi:XTP/dITP diphosphohydrolase